MAEDVSGNQGDMTSLPEKPGMADAGALAGNQADEKSLPEKPGMADAGTLAGNQGDMNSTRNVGKE